MEEEAAYRSRGVRVSTLHSAKGVDFPVVMALIRSHELLLGRERAEDQVLVKKTDV